MKVVLKDVAAGDGGLSTYKLTVKTKAWHDSVRYDVRHMSFLRVRSE